MRVTGLNFRGDLAKLTDEEIEKQFEQLIAQRRALGAMIDNFDNVGNRWLYDQGLGVPFGRGPVRSPAIYRLIAFFYACSFKKGLGRLYMIDCELKDIMDECRRRIAARSRHRGEVR